MGAHPSEGAVGRGPLVTTLQLTDFRNYTSVNLNLNKRFVVLAGSNGAGKTNLLEALSLLNPGRGLRRARFDSLVRKGSPAGWSVFCRLDLGGEETAIGTGLHRSGEHFESARRTRINGASVKSADQLLDYLRILWLTPAMDALFTGPATERRRFIDRLTMTVDPSHARRARTFERLMRGRNRLLEEHADPSYLDAVETEFAEVAIGLADARANLVSGLIASIASQKTDGSEFPVAGLDLVGEFESENRELMTTGTRPEDRTDWYRNRLRHERRRDEAAGRTLFGPHRSDLSVTFVAKGMPAALSSTGEQKALLIGLVLAQAQLVSHSSTQAPILLLDEIAAHLDPDRRSALFNRLETMGTQAFMTGTDISLFSALGTRAQALSVENGAISAFA